MHPTEDLIPILKKLRLSGVLETLDLRRRQAVDDSLSFDEFLYRLLYDEVERRDRVVIQPVWRPQPWPNEIVVGPGDVSVTGKCIPSIAVWPVQPSRYAEFRRDAVTVPTSEHALPKKSSDVLFGTRSR